MCSRGGNGAALVRHANTTINRAHHRLDLQSKSTCGGHHPAVLLLRRWRSDHAASFDSARILFGSGGGISGTTAGAANPWSNGDGADPGFAACGVLRRAADVAIGLSL